MNEFVENIIRAIGASFCHVNIINAFVQFKPSIISGNQKWNGAAPIFVNRAELKINLKYNVKLMLYIKFIDIKIIDKSSREEASAWVTKYFNEASDAIILLVFLIKGIMESRLISNPIHILIQEYEEIEIKVPIINVE